MRFAALAARKGLLMVEDAAQGLGSRFKGRYAGTFGIASAISFYPAKVLGCFGDGGAVIANDDYVRDRVCQMRDHSRDSDSPHSFLGAQLALGQFAGGVSRRSTAAL